MMRPTTTVALASCVLMLGCGRTIETDRPAVNGAQAHDDAEAVHLDPAQLAELGIRVSTAAPGVVEVSTELPGEVQINGDHMAHVAPTVGGVVLEVFASLGDEVREGQVLAVLSSRELADAKAALLAANERLKLAEATFSREERLYTERISSEQDFLDARRGLAEARIERRAAEQKLIALGFTPDHLDRLTAQHNEALTLYRLTAPFDGTVIDRHITTGETVEAGTAVFSVANLRTVWIDLAVYQRDIGAVKAGQTVHLTTEHGEEAVLQIDYVQPLVGEQTRTAKARIIADNSDGTWHPGCYVTATVTTSRVSAAVVVPPSAIINMDDGDEVVFVVEADRFAPRPVASGRTSRTSVEIVSGLTAGERFVAEGGFNLKAELGKHGFGDPHGH